MKHLLKIIFLFSLSMRYNGQTQELPDREIHYRPGDWISYPMSRYVTSITLGQQYTYFGTTGGILRYDFYRNRWQAPFTWSDGLEDDHILIVAYDFTTGYLWCATRVGLSYRVPSSQAWWNISYRGLNIEPVSAMGVGNRYIWIESDRMIMKGDHSGGAFWRAAIDEATADDVQWRRRGERRRFDDGDYFFMDGGFSFFPEGYIQDNNLRRFDITETMRDRFENLWMGTWGLGCCTADLKTSFLERIPFGPFISDVNAMAWDGEGMWMGGNRTSGDMSGITWWDMERDEWLYFEARLISQFRSDGVSAILPGDRYVWFGTDEGLIRYDRDKDAWKNFSVHDNLWDNIIYSLALSENALWVGTASGVNRIWLSNMSVEQVRDKRLIHRKIFHLEADGEDVWAATDWGIYRFVAAGDAWQAVSGYSGMVDQSVTAVSVWEDEVWFGTDDGIEMYDTRKDAWQGFPSMHYPTGGAIYNILADSGIVWFGTEEGVLKYIKKENRWHRFTTQDGLLNNSVRWILLDGDYIWFGTERGLTRFYWNAPYRVD